MAYKALYRQFRPRRFSELKGQDAISTVLKNQKEMVFSVSVSLVPQKTGNVTAVSTNVSVIKV